MKKECYFKQNNIKHIDYKDTETLAKFLTPHSRLNGTRKTGVSSKHQRNLAQAVKRSRFMALIPYVSR
jgi:small subunit ribosomal protein S18